jgi:hypothetical protein
MYYIKISGYIPPEKVNEFKITADSCFANWKQRCIDLNFSKDLIYNDLCHYQSTWNTKDSYKEFMKSEDYKVLEGCFRVLGSINKITHGEMISEQENP